MAQVVVLLETEECVHERWRATPLARAHAAAIRKARMLPRAPRQSRVCC